MLSRVSSNEAILQISDPVSISDKATGIWQGPSGQTQGLFEHSKERTLFASSDGGRTKTFASGTPSKGEKDNPEVADRLTEWLRQYGGAWQCHLSLDSGQADQGVDIQCRSDSGEVIDCQVVRATVEREFWKELGDQHSVQRQFNASEGVCRIKTSIESKCRIPAAQRSDLVLVLDATRAAGLALPPIPEAFRRDHGPWASSLGFKGILLVGPNANLTNLLTKESIVGLSDGATQARARRRRESDRG